MNNSNNNNSLQKNNIKHNSKKNKCKNDRDSMSISDEIPLTIKTNKTQKNRDSRVIDNQDGFDEEIGAILPSENINPIYDNHFEIESKHDNYLQSSNKNKDHMIPDLDVSLANSSLPNNNENDDIKFNDCENGVTNNNCDLIINNDDFTTVKKGVLLVHENYDKLSSKIFSRWKKRYFVLTTDYFVCFKRSLSKVGHSEMGSFIYKASLCDILRISWLKVKNSEKGPLVMHIRGRPNMLLWSKQNLAEWLLLLHEAIDRSKLRRSIKLAAPMLLLKQASRKPTAADINNSQSKLTNANNASDINNNYYKGNAFASEANEDDLYENGGGLAQGDSFLPSNVPHHDEKADMRPTKQLPLDSPSENPLVIGSESVNEATIATELEPSSSLEASSGHGTGDSSTGQEPEPESLTHEPSPDDATIVCHDGHVKRSTSGLPLTPENRKESNKTKKNLQDNRAFIPAASASSDQDNELMIKVLKVESNCAIKSSQKSPKSGASKKQMMDQETTTRMNDNPPLEKRNNRGDLDEKEALGLQTETGKSSGRSLESASPAHEDQDNPTTNESIINNNNNDNHAHNNNSHINDGHNRNDNNPPPDCDTVNTTRRSSLKVHLSDMNSSSLSSNASSSNRATANPDSSLTRKRKELKQTTFISNSKTQIELPISNLIRRDDSWQSLVSLTRIGHKEPAFGDDSTTNNQKITTTIASHMAHAFATPQHSTQKQDLKLRASNLSSEKRHQLHLMGSAFNRQQANVGDGAPDHQNGRRSIRTTRQLSNEETTQARASYSSAAIAAALEKNRLHKIDIESTVTPLRGPLLRHQSLAAAPSGRQQQTTRLAPIPIARVAPNSRPSTSFELDSSSPSSRLKSDINSNCNQNNNNNNDNDMASNSNSNCNGNNNWDPSSHRKLLHLQFLTRNNNNNNNNSNNNNNHGSQDHYQIYEGADTSFQHYGHLSGAAYSSTRSNLKSAASEFSFIRPLASCSSSSARQQDSPMLTPRTLVGSSMYQPSPLMSSAGLGSSFRRSSRNRASHQEMRNQLQHQQNPIRTSLLFTKQLNANSLDETNNTPKHPIGLQHQSSDSGMLMMINQQPHQQYHHGAGPNLSSLNYHQVESSQLAGLRVGEQNENNPNLINNKKHNEHDNIMMSGHHPAGDPINSQLVVCDNGQVTHFESPIMMRDLPMKPSKRKKQKPKGKQNPNNYLSSSSFGEGVVNCDGGHQASSSIPKSSSLTSSIASFFRRAFSGRRRSRKALAPDQQSLSSGAFYSKSLSTFSDNNNNTALMAAGSSRVGAANHLEARSAFSTGGKSGFQLVDHNHNKTGNLVVEPSNSTTTVITPRMVDMIEAFQKNYRAAAQLANEEMDEMAEEPEQNQNENDEPPAAPNHHELAIMGTPTSNPSTKFVARQTKRVSPGGFIGDQQRSRLIALNQAAAFSSHQIAIPISGAGSRSGAGVGTPKFQNPHYQHHQLTGSSPLHKSNSMSIAMASSHELNQRHHRNLLESDFRPSPAASPLIGRNNNNQNNNASVKLNGGNEMNQTYSQKLSQLHSSKLNQHQLQLSPMFHIRSQRVLSANLTPQKQSSSAALSCERSDFIIEHQQHHHQHQFMNGNNQQQHDLPTPLVHQTPRASSRNSHHLMPRPSSIYGQPSLISSPLLSTPTSIMIDYGYGSRK